MQSRSTNDIEASWRSRSARAVVLFKPAMIEGSDFVRIGMLPEMND
jgi:hypothetical protein